MQQHNNNGNSDDDYDAVCVFVCLPTGEVTAITQTLKFIVKSSNYTAESFSCFDRSDLVPSS